MERLTSSMNGSESRGGVCELKAATSLESSIIDTFNCQSTSTLSRRVVPHFSPIVPSPPSFFSFDSKSDSRVYYNHRDKGVLFYTSASDPRW